MAIMAMLGLAFLAQSETTVQRQKHENFINAIEEVLAAMRSARTGAISSRTFGLDEDLNPVAPEGGFGVHLDVDSANNTITLTEFVDDSDGINPTPDGIYTEGSDSQISQRTINAHWATTFRNHSPNTGGIDTTELTVLFVAPDAEMTINDNDASHDLTSAEVFFRYGNITRLICLNRVSRYVEAISAETCQ